MHYLQFTFHAYCGAAGPVSKMALQQEKAFCVLCFEVSRSVITVQREFRAKSKKDASHKNSVFLNRARNPRYILFTDLDTSKDSFCCCNTILETGPAAPQ
jgi:hypothetical protein